MMLRVTDNGQGMTPERLYEVQKPSAPVNVPGSDLLRCQRELHSIMVRVMD